MSCRFPRNSSAELGWSAQLRLGFERRAKRTELVRRQHAGPLLVQKALHPEGDDLCHAIVLHPPSGLVGGDQLALEVTVEEGAAALLTTPGASKWYRSAGAPATSKTSLHVRPGASLEFLPREAIVFDGAMGRAHLSIDLADDARLAVWDVWCLGRTHAAEQFTHGRLEICLEIAVDGRECVFEQGCIDGGSELLTRSAALGGAPVFGTLLVKGAMPSQATLNECRALPLRQGQGGITVLPQFVCARYLGHSTEAAHAWFAALWAMLRPEMLGRAAVAPRIWAV